METLKNAMISNISFQAARLEEARFQMFLRWLASHSGMVKKGEIGQCSGQPRNKETCCSELVRSLELWFSVLSVSGLIWEYQLILTEIRWWRSLDAQSLSNMLQKDIRGETV